MPTGHYERYPGLNDGLRPDERRCSKCREVKPRSAYSPDRRHHADGLQSICKSCRKGREKEWRDGNPEEHKRRCREQYIRHRPRKAAYGAEWSKRNPDKKRQYGLKERYGLTPEGYVALLGQQSGKCGICGTDRPGGRGRFHVDHDHATGAVRGLLCAGCNISLGVYEKPGFLEAAARYLNRHKTGSQTGPRDDGAK